MRFRELVTSSTGTLPIACKYGRWVICVIVYITRFKQIYVCLDSYASCFCGHMSQWNRHTSMRNKTDFSIKNLVYCWLLTNRYWTLPVILIGWFRMFIQKSFSLEVSTYKAWIHILYRKCMVRVLCYLVDNIWRLSDDMEHVMVHEGWFMSDETWWMMHVRWNIILKHFVYTL